MAYDHPTIMEVHAMPITSGAYGGAPAELPDGVPGQTRTRQREKIYPCAISTQVSQAMKDALADEIERRRSADEPANEADVVRDWLDAGRAASTRSARRAAVR